MASSKCSNTLLNTDLTAHLARVERLTLEGDTCCRFPFFLTIAHLIIGIVALGPVMALPRFADGHIPTLRDHWKGIACVGAFKVCQTLQNKTPPFCPDASARKMQMAPESMASGP